MKATSKGNATRMLHVMAGSTIAAYIYSPSAESVLFRNVMKSIGIPLPVISGLWLWNGHYLMSFLTNNRNTFLLASLCSLFNPCSIAQAKATYLINAEKVFRTEVGLGFIIQPESTAKANDAFNVDGLYSANMLWIVIRDFFWKSLHIEYVLNFGRARITSSKVDGKVYSAFVIFSQSFIGYKRNVLTREIQSVFFWTRRIWSFKKLEPMA